MTKPTKPLDTLSPERPFMTNHTATLRLLCTRLNLNAGNLATVLGKPHASAKRYLNGRSFIPDHVMATLHDLESNVATLAVHSFNEAIDGVDYDVPLVMYYGDRQYERLAPPELVGLLPVVALYQVMINHLILMLDEQDIGYTLVEAEGE